MPPSPQQVAADACFVINVLAVDRVDLLAGLGGSHRFRIPDEVRAEVIRPDEVARLEVAVASGILDVVEITDFSELSDYAGLRRAGLGAGEAACLALATSRGWSIASDERGKFRRLAAERIGADRLVTTPQMLALAIDAGLLGGQDGRSIAEELRRSHRFSMDVPDDW